MSEQRDGTGTGTGVWTHPAAEPEQKRCECGACVFEAGPMAWYWQPMQEEMLRRVHEYSHLRIYPNDCGFAHCPGECGCRLSVVDGEPHVGEKYADLERDAQRFRAVERAMGPPLDSPFNTHRWHFETDGIDTRYATLGEYADALGGETDEHDA